MNFPAKKIKNDMEAELSEFISEQSGLQSFIAQCFLFHGEKYMGWDCFDKNSVTIGKGPEADIILEDDNLDDIQVTLRISQKGILVTNTGNAHLTLVNDRIITQCILGPMDFVKIGLYTIKIKLKKIETNTSQTNQIFKPEQVVQKIKKAETDIKVVKKEYPAVDSSEPDIAETPFKKRVETDTSIYDYVVYEDGQTPEIIRKKKASPEFKEIAPEIVIDPSLEITLKINKETETIIEELPKSEVKPSSLEKTLKVNTGFKLPKKQKKTEVKPAVRNKKKTLNSFPASFFNPDIYADDEEDDDDDDIPANFTLKEKLTGQERNAGRRMTPEKRYEILKFRQNNLISINHLGEKQRHCLINQKNSFCRIDKEDNGLVSLFFTRPLLGKINISNEKKLETQQVKSLRSLLLKQKTYKTFLPGKSAVNLSDGTYDYVLRPTFITKRAPERQFRKDDTPLKQRLSQSVLFRNLSKAVITHLIILIVLSFTIEMPDIEEFKNPETHFAVVDTTNIHKPVKPKPKPKPKRIVQKKKPIIKEKVKKPGTQVASLRKKKIKKPGKPKAGGGHKGTLVNRNVNELGLLSTLGIKKGISIKPNAALAAVTNIDAVTSTHSKEARLKLGGIVGSLGDQNIAIPTGGVINTKGSTNVLRSAGIGGKGSVAALETGKTGQRAVQGTVQAPLTKKIRSKGGGISRDAVAKVINDHLDEIYYCYETALIGEPALMGKVVFEWKILPSGKVGEVKIKSSTLRSSEIHSCIKSALRTWRFPKPKGGAAIISYPFVFDVSGF